jgi:hypothetical protein
MLKISMDQEEIEKALTSHMGETMSGLDLSTYDINIKLIAGRSGNGLRAEVDLVPLTAHPPAASENDAVTDTAAEITEDSEEKVVGEEPFDFDD